MVVVVVVVVVYDINVKNFPLFSLYGFFVSFEMVGLDFLF